VTGWWFSPCTPVSSTNKTDRHMKLSFRACWVTISVFSGFHNNITSLKFSYWMDWTDYESYNLIIVFINDNPQVIATSSSPLIILICKEIIFFLKTVSVIWLAVKQFTRTNQNVLKWLVSNSWLQGFFCFSWIMRVEWLELDYPWVTYAANKLTLTFHFKLLSNSDTVF